MSHSPNLHSPLENPLLLLLFSLSLSICLPLALSPSHTLTPHTLTHTLCTPHVYCACMFYNVFVDSFSGNDVLLYNVYIDPDLLYTSLSNTHSSQTATDSSQGHTQMLYYITTYSVTEHLLSLCSSLIS